ncbi:MAG: hypothetical protein J5988_07735 [Eubacterium sp.]|nr:hypothetical protein [Eubacterium sp.]
MNNAFFVNKLFQKYGGKVSEKGRSRVWCIGGKNYLVRCSKESILVNKPKTFHVDGIVFYLSKHNCWGKADFSKKSLKKADANEGVWEGDI